MDNGENYNNPIKRRNQMKRYFFVLTLIGLALFLANACTQSESAPPVATTDWRLDGHGYVQFSTNDPDYYGYVFWCYYDQEDQVAPMTNAVTGIVKKMSGALNYGFGIIFCVQDIENFFWVLITAEGYYVIGESEDNVPSKIIDYTFSGAINTGLGASNTISVTYTSGMNTMAVAINGSQVNTFQPNTGSSPFIQNWTGGKAGFITLIGNSTDENFPDTASDVRFKLTSPVALP
jgi:hypothetical protein